MTLSQRWAVGIFGATLLFVITLFVWPLPVLLAFLSDDAFYYLQIGHSISIGAGSTFDGIVLTNGYHPLWMLVVVFLMTVTGNETLFSAAAVMAASVVICGGCVYLAVNIVEKFVARGLAAISAATMLSPFAFSAMTNGMETSLAMFAVLAVMWHCFKARALSADAGIASSFVFGALLAIVFLSRLDMAFLPLTAGLLIVAESIRVRAPFRALTIRTLAMLAPFLLITAPFFVWNYLEFGSIAPISGSVKSSFPVVRESLHLEGDSQIGLAMLVLLSLCTFLSFRRRSNEDSALTSPLVLVTFACWLHFAYAFLFMDWGVYWWHFTLSAVSLSIAIPAALYSLKLTSRHITHFGALALAAFCIVLQLQVTMNRYDRHLVWLEAAQWAKENTAETAIFAIKDAGLFRYFSDRQVVNLDGKANGLSYWRSVRNGSVDSYLGDVGVRYIGEINAGCFDQKCFIRIHVPRQPDVFLEMMDQGLIYSGRPYPKRFGSSAPMDTRFRIWSYPSG